MSKPEWGTKRVCQSCSAVYYDMRRQPPTCPQCSTKFDPEALLRSRRGRTMPDDGAAPKAVAEVAPELAVLEDDAVVEDLPDDEEDEEGDALLEDASELGEDDDAVGVPVVGED